MHGILCLQPVNELLKFIGRFELTIHEHVYARGAETGAFADHGGGIGGNDEALAELNEGRNGIICIARVDERIIKGHGFNNGFNFCGCSA